MRKAEALDRPASEASTLMMQPGSAYIDQVLFQAVLNLRQKQAAREALAASEAVAAQTTGKRTRK